MKIAIAYLSIACLLPALSSAFKGTAEDITQQFLNMPPCGINCTFPVLIENKCFSTNVSKTAECMCKDIEAERTVSECVLAKCSYEDLVKVEKLQYNLCYDEPRPSRKSSLLGVTIFVTIVTSLMVSARCYSRCVISREFWWDDWFLCLSLIIFLGITATNYWGIELGFGVHVWNVDPDRNVRLYQYEYVFQILYEANIASTRASIALLIYRIFPQRWMHRICCFLISTYFVVWVVYTGLTIFQCNPVALVFDKTRKGTCINFHYIILSGAIITIVDNVTLLVLPIPSILKLHLDWRKKLEIISIMSIGLMAFICSLVRMKYVVAFNYSIDINWDDIPISIISEVELAVSIWCVCFPAIKLLIARSCPKSIFRLRSRPRGPRTSMAVNLSNATQPEPTGAFYDMRSRMATMFGMPPPGIRMTTTTTKTSTGTGSSSEGELESLPHVNEDGLASTVNSSVDRLWHSKV